MTENSGYLELGNLVIRQPVPDDMVHLKQMWANSWLKVYPNDEYGITASWVKTITDMWFTPEAMAKDRESVATLDSRPHVLYRVAQIGPEIVGVLFGIRYPAGESELRAIYVAADYLGSGVGQALMDEALAQLGPGPIKLDVAPYNHRAIRFYQRNGFVEVPDSRGLYPMIANAYPGSDGKSPELISGVNAIPAINMIRPSANS